MALEKSMRVAMPSHMAFPSLLRQWRKAALNPCYNAEIIVPVSTISFSQYLFSMPMKISPP
jgi:hypothetical protein